MEGIDFNTAFQVIVAITGLIYVIMQIVGKIRSNSINKTDSDQNEEINKHELRIKNLEANASTAAAESKTISDSLAARIPVLEQSVSDLDRRQSISEKRVDGIRKLVDEQLEKELNKIEKKIDDQSAKSESNFNYMVDLILRVLGEEKKVK